MSVFDILSLHLFLLPLFHLLLLPPVTCFFSFLSSIFLLYSFSLFYFSPSAQRSRPPCTVVIVVYSPSCGVFVVCHRCHRRLPSVLVCHRRRLQPMVGRCGCGWSLGGVCCKQ
ncbi:hypothetical protein GBA52_010248 [Prunus armeniaca]|nr:hypothetical protein GBA52_010248 [Prunus armeniaca]